MTTNELKKRYLISTGMTLKHDIIVVNSEIFIYSQVFRQFKKSYVHQLATESLQYHIDCAFDKNDCYINRAFAFSLLASYNLRKRCHAHYIATTNDKFIQTFEEFETHIREIFREIDTLTTILEDSKNA